MIPAWDRRPEGQKYDLPHQEPPSWSEEQRVSRAFWHVLSFYNLRIAGIISKLNWPKKDLEKLLAIGPIDLHTDLRGIPAQKFPDEEVLTILDYIEEIHMDDVSVNVLDGKSPISLLRPNDRRYWPAPLPPATHIERKRMILPTFPIAIFNSLTVNDWSPLKNVSFGSFRKLGFALWSRHRMADSGFDHPDPTNKNQQKRSLDSYYFTWRSILSAEEIEEVERPLRENIRHRSPR